MKHVFKSKLWRWKGDAPAAWHFITLPSDLAGQLKFFSGSRKGFGTLKVSACIGDVSWTTSLFPDKATGSYLLPVKSDVRKQTRVIDGDIVSVIISYDP